MSLPQPLPLADARRIVEETAEEARIRDLAPTAQELAEAVGSEVVTEADGSWRVPITRESADRDVNGRRWDTYMDMTAAKRAAETERSQKRAETTPTVPMLHTPSGEVRSVPLSMAQHAEDKGMRWKPRLRWTTRVVYDERGNRREYHR